MSEMNEGDKRFLAGIIYGDGCIDKKGRITITHSIAQRSYLEYKTKILEDRYDLRTKIYQKKPTGFSTGIMLHMYAHSKTWLKKLREEWYPNGKKQVPEDIIKSFGWDEWVIIYQDNGRLNKISHTSNLIKGVRVRVDISPVVNRYEICLGYPTDSQIDALKYSLNMMGIESSVLNRKDGQRNISISRASSKIVFHDNIRPRIHPSMEYKIGLPPTFSYASRTTKREGPERASDSLNFGITNKCKEAEE